MLIPRSRWSFPEPVEVPADLREDGARRGLSDRVLEVIVRRGLLDDGGLEAFLAPPEDGLHDPGLLPDAERFLARIRRARTDGEGVLVFGDFDADGLSGLATMTLALRRAGLRAEPYVPSRQDEGHGLSLRAIETARAGACSVIVTVDCGSTSHAEIAVAVEHGIDVLVTDHHRMPDSPPAAHAIVNPHRADGFYPDRRITGSGVAFKVAQLILAEIPGGPEAALDLADLAIIGTVSDVAPIVGENRAIARIGLDRLRRGTRPGLAALLASAGVAPASVDLETISFVLAPRINAAGRMGEATDAAALLLAGDAETATMLAGRLESANDARRDLTKQTQAEVEAAVLAVAGTASEPAIVVHGPWPVGIIGLVAARLAEHGGRPVVIGADVGDIVRASCRASGFDLAAALDECHDLLIRHGGHAGAAGFEIEAGRWDAFRERFLGVAALTERPAADPRPELRLDLALPAPEVDYPLLREFAVLAPAGQGNPEPLIAILGLTVTRVRAASGGHTQLTLRRDRDVLDGIAFGRPDLAESVAAGDRVDVVASLASRTFGGFESLQLIVRDVAPSGSLPAAAAILAGGPRPVAVMADAPAPAVDVAPMAVAAIGGPDR
ncbi:MAG TPA: single-stranded-DNA-specific exonuclease RecJ [Candidatus Limnocylindrales bacterium]